MKILKYKVGYNFLIFFFVGVISTNLTKAQEVITIQQAIDNTLKNNLQIKQAKFSESLNELNLQQSKLALAPSFNANIGQNLGWGRNQVASGLYQNTKNLSINGGLSTGLELFGGFFKINQIKQNKALLEAGKSNIEKTKNDLTLAVIKAYMQVLFNKDLLIAAKEQKKVSLEQYEQMQAFLSAGTKTTADVSQAKSQLATADANLINTETSLSLSFLDLSQLMEIPSSSVYDVKAPSIEQVKILNASLYQAEDVYQKSLVHFPDVRLAEENTKAADLGVKIAKANLYPRLSFNASLGTSYFNSQNPFIANASFEKQIKDNLSKGIGFSLNIPIFNGLQSRIGVKRAKVNLMQAQSQEQLTKNNLNKIIYQAVSDAKGGEGKYNSAKNVFEAQKDAFYAIEQRYRVGLANSVEYNTALTNKNKAELDMIQAKYELLFKIKVIDFYLGKTIEF